MVLWLQLLVYVIHHVIVMLLHSAAVATLDLEVHPQPHHPDPFHPMSSCSSSSGQGHEPLVLGADPPTSLSPFSQHPASPPPLAGVGHVVFLFGVQNHGWNASHRALAAIVGILLDCKDCGWAPPSWKHREIQCLVGTLTASKKYEQVVEGEIGV